MFSLILGTLCERCCLTPEETKNQMKIEIWSDIACPFCYIGKRKLEKAIQKLLDSSSIQIEWKSYQLNPDLQTNENQDTLAYLSETKGWSLAQTK